MVLKRLETTQEQIILDHLQYTTYEPIPQTGNKPYPSFDMIEAIKSLSSAGYFFPEQLHEGLNLQKKTDDPKYKKLVQILDSDFQWAQNDPEDYPNLIELEYKDDDEHTIKYKLKPDGSLEFDSTDFSIFSLLGPIFGSLGLIDTQLALFQALTYYAKNNFDPSLLFEGLNLVKKRFPKIGDDVQFYVNGHDGFDTGKIYYIKDSEKEIWIRTSDEFRYVKRLSHYKSEYPLRAWWFADEQPNPKMLNEGLNLPKKPPMVIELTSDLFPIVDVGTYESQLDAYNFLRETDEMSREGNDHYWLYFDNGKYMNFIKEEVTNYIQEHIVGELRDLNLGIRDVKVDKIVSPRQYNYGTDNLYFDLIVAPNFIEILINDIKQQEISELESFLEGAFSSQPGFASYMPNSINALIDALNDPKEIERGVAAYLTYKTQNEQEGWKDGFYDYINEDAWTKTFDVVTDMPEDIYEKLVVELNGGEVNWNESDNEEPAPVKPVRDPNQLSLFSDDELSEGLNLAKKPKSDDPLYSMFNYLKNTPVGKAVATNYGKELGQSFSSIVMWKPNKSASISYDKTSNEFVVFVRDDSAGVAKTQKVQHDGMSKINVEDIVDVFLYDNELSEGLNLVKKSKPMIPLTYLEDVVVYPEGNFHAIPHNIIMDLKGDDIIHWDEEGEGQWGIEQDNEWILEFFNEHEKLPLKYSDGFTYIKEHDNVLVADPTDNDDAWQGEFQGTVVGFAGPYVYVEDGDNDVFSVEPHKLTKDE